MNVDTVGMAHRGWDPYHQVVPSRDPFAVRRWSLHFHREGQPSLFAPSLLGATVVLLPPTFSICTLVPEGDVMLRESAHRILGL